MKREKIISITHYTTLYGANRSLLNLISGSRHEFEWIVFCRKMRRGEEGGDIRKELERLNIICYTIPFRTDVFIKRKSFIQNSFVFICELCFNFLMAFFVAIYAKIKNVNYIHTNSSATCFGAYVSIISNIKHVWHFREFLWDDYNYSYKFGLNYLVFWANKASLIIAISQSIFNKCIKGRNISSNATVIFNGIIFKADVPKMTEKALKYPIKVLIVGVIDQSKNHLEAIKAIELLSNKGCSISLDVVGIPDGSYYDMLTAYIRDNKLDEIINFKGYISNMRDIFKEADVTFVCSKNEAMGRVTIESMAYGIPIIGYDAAGTSELIENNYSGILYSGSEVELASALENLLMDPILYDKLRTNGYREVNQKYLVERYRENFIKSIKN